MSIFGALEVYHDAAQSAAMNMAIDEALLEMANLPAIRFYRWHSPALSFGYFGRFADVVDYAAQRDLVRRWTGGGIVLHGDDLTYSVIIPARDSLFAGSSMSIYAAVHSAMRNALVASGECAQMAPIESPRVSESCFANPVRADVMVNGRKVAGAAQRRTRAGLLHQGSIQQIDLGKDFTERFAQELSDKWTARNLDQTIFNRAQEIGQQKYANQAWLRRR
jgi:lipoate-protein ligase A